VSLLPEDCGEMGSAAALLEVETVLRVSECDVWMSLLLSA
jgi:hypothetical protein